MKQEYTELQHVPGRWIMEGRKEDYAWLVGREYTLTYHDSSCRVVRVSKIHTYGGLIVPEIETIRVHKLPGDYAKPELIHYYRLVKGVF